MPRGGLIYGAVFFCQVPYHSDCEYNRKGFNDPKWLDGYPGRTSTRDSKGSTTFPDIIVHLRGVDLANLLVIEVKKSTNPEKDELDQWKLNKFVVSNDYTLRGQ